MKKLIVILALIITILCLEKQRTITIPQEAIRFRVIANSNSEKDQNIKKEVVKQLRTDIKKIEFIPKNINSSRNIIKENIPILKKTIENTLNHLNTNESYTINYGTNYFPEKKYKGVVYEEGEYESLVVTLGDGLGDNFWCVLFPPLCLLEGEETEKDEIEYTSFIQEIINKYF